MKKYAIVKIGGTQYKVAEGDEIEVDKIDSEKGKTLSFDQVLLLAEDNEVKIGQPLIKGAQIKAKMLDQIKGEKVRVATYKAKSRSRKVKGFRASLTKIKIEKIVSA
ncbi:MAG: 50S ribosomal protein L21 [Candidatus Shapirobacteria bacterium]|nr:50S ribosomal protein L21 [Candidatus Shapirobacteria bacterium]